MLTVTVQTNGAEFAREIRDVEDRLIPRATMRALSNVGWAAKGALEREMRDVFDRPTPWTMGSVRVFKGRGWASPWDKRALEQGEIVVGHVEDTNKQGVPVWKYLLPNIRGGGRRLKRFEKALRSVGVLPSGMVAVAGKAAEMDFHGNVSAGQIIQILSYFRAFGEKGYRANITDKGRSRLRRGTKSKLGIAYFALDRRHGKLPPGIYKRVHLVNGTLVKPILVFVEDAVYESIYDVEYTVRSTVDKQWPSEFRKALVELSGPKR